MPSEHYNYYIQFNGHITNAHIPDYTQKVLLGILIKFNCHKSFVVLYY